MTKLKQLFTRKSNYRTVFESEEGKVVLADLYKFCGLDRPSYVENSSDRTAYNEGMKRVALRIKGILNQDEEQLKQLLNQHDQNNIVNYRSTTNQ